MTEFENLIVQRKFRKFKKLVSNQNNVVIGFQPKAFWAAETSSRKGIWSIRYKLVLNCTSMLLFSFFLMENYYKRDEVLFCNYAGMICNSHQRLTFLWMRKGRGRLQWCKSVFKVLLANFSSMYGFVLVVHFGLY